MKKYDEFLNEEYNLETYKKISKSLSSRGDARGRELSKTADDLMKRQSNKILKEFEGSEIKIKILEGVFENETFIIDIRNITLLEDQGRGHLKIKCSLHDPIHEKIETSDFDPFGEENWREVEKMRKKLEDPTVQESADSDKIIWDFKKSYELEKDPKKRAMILKKIEELIKLKDKYKFIKKKEDQIKPPTENIGDDEDEFLPDEREDREDHERERREELEYEEFIKKLKKNSKRDPVVLNRIEFTILDYVDHGIKEHLQIVDTMIKGLQGQERVRFSCEIDRHSARIVSKMFKSVNIPVKSSQIRQY